MSSKSQSLLPKRPPPVTDRLAIDGWLDDGGSLAPAREWRSVRRPRSLKLPADTVTGCMDRAAADLLAAAAMTTKNGRLRMEASSASWAERANLIQQMDDSFEARRKLIY
ncbi:hypothetical protein LVY65_02685 [Sphingomonas sp. G124]|uniref:Uncharacterized protein n=1 Tax=Sphingomonas cremea TaxID=2904799 RepID=A0A9X1QID3_9SPHN|nr:hypothetical protein [Sphingomonas cremea]MCF2513976.1 hypothetical protein [Sphingomonas cremea]